MSENHLYDFDQFRMLGLRAMYLMLAGAVASDPSIVRNLSGTGWKGYLRGN